MTQTSQPAVLEPRQALDYPVRGLDGPCRSVAGANPQQLQVHGRSRSSWCRPAVAL